MAGCSLGSSWSATSTTPWCARLGCGPRRQRRRRRPRPHPPTSHPPLLTARRSQVQNEDATHERLLGFGRVWSAEFAGDCLLVYSTGRSPELYEELWVGFTEPSIHTTSHTNPYATPPNNWQPSSQHRPISPPPPPPRPAERGSTTGAGRAHLQRGHRALLQGRRRQLPAGRALACAAGPGGPLEPRRGREGGGWLQAPHAPGGWGSAPAIQRCQWRVAALPPTAHRCPERCRSKPASSARTS
jgi:hypothetical protein